MGGLVDPPPAQAIGLENAPDISSETSLKGWVVRGGGDDWDHLGELDTGLLI